jgi:hypothetical protein
MRKFLIVLGFLGLIFKRVGYVFIGPDYLRIGEGDSLMDYKRN